MPADASTPTTPELASVLGVAPTEPPPRLSADSVLQESSRPVTDPGQPAEVSANGRAAARHIVDVHDGYRAEMLQVLDVLDQVQRGTLDIGTAQSTLARMTIRANDWTLGGYCMAQCRELTEHHGIEDDSVFPYLRRCNSNLAPVLDRLDDEHRAIHELLERVDVELITLVQNPTAYGPLRNLMGLLHDTIMSHFSYEERELMLPLAQFGFYQGQL